MHRLVVYGVWVSQRDMIYGGIISLAAFQIFAFQCPEIPIIVIVLRKALI